MYIKFYLQHYTSTLVNTYKMQRLGEDTRHFMMIMIKLILQ